MNWWSSLIWINSISPMTFMLVIGGELVTSIIGAAAGAAVVLFGCPFITDLLMSLIDDLAVFAVQPGRSEAKAKAMESEPFEQLANP